MGKRKKNIETINSLKKANKFKPYIDYIRFPFFKNIHPDTKINFEFPFTVLVGKNGCGKSSVLHALYGSPGGNSVGDFWFSTHLDPIKESSGGRNKLIYGFYSIEAKRKVEVIKTRIQYKRKDGRINPDYWEPSRPLKSDGMEDMPPLSESKVELLGRSKTRWNPIDKNVVYINFRSELSAFDKFFNFNELANTHQNKQDYLRNWSKPLKEAIYNKSKSYSYYGIQRVIENRSFSDEEIKTISCILEKDYKSGIYIEHCFFRAEGYSVIFKTDSIEYSEAFAGSGESIVARLVVKVLNAPEHSLILLDEPEISLHPGAQNKLRDFLFDQIIKKKHQIILATHSPIFVKDLPQEAVKLFYPDTDSGKFQVKNETYPAEAFHHIGSLLHSKKTIIVEDKLAKEIIQRSLKLIGGINKDFVVEYYPGGVEVLIGNYVPYHALNEDKNVWFILDGDKKNVEEHIDPDNIPENENQNLFKKIKEQVGQEIKFNRDSNNPQQIISLQRQFLKFYRNRVFYLPNKTPEKFIWDNVESLKKQEKNPECYKHAFERYTQCAMDKEHVNSEQIFVIQQLELAKVSNDCNDMKDLINTLKIIIAASSNS